MQTKKQSPKQQKAQERSRAKSILEGYHEGSTLDDKLMRKDILIHMLVCIVTSEWWLANNDLMRTDIIHHIVRVDDTLDALDVIHN